MTDDSSGHTVDRDGSERAHLEHASTEHAGASRSDAPHADAERGAERTAAEPLAGSHADGALAPQYGVGPFSVREVALGGVWLLAFIVSFFSLSTAGDGERTFSSDNVWVSGVSWILAIALPTAAVFLLALRRLSPQGIRRVGSLGIDQFASVAFSVAALLWFSWLWETIAFAIEVGVWARSWVVWVETVLMLAGVVLTVFAPLLPVLRDDFRGRREVPAHRNARPVRAVSPRPARPRPTPAPQEQGAQHTGGYAPHQTPQPASQQTPQHTAVYGAGTNPTGGYAPSGYGAPAAAERSSYDSAGYAPLVQGDAVDPSAQQVDGSRDTGYAVPAPESFDAASPATATYDQAASQTSAGQHPQSATTDDTDVFAALVDDTRDEQADEPVTTPATQAFWALVPEERDIVDDYGRPLFRIGPTAWALVIEDRGAAFVVRHEDGRIGFLHDVSGVTRG